MTATSTGQLHYHALDSGSTSFESCLRSSSSNRRCASFSPLLPFERDIDFLGRNILKAQNVSRPVKTSRCLLTKWLYGDPLQIQNPSNMCYLQEITCQSCSQIYSKNIELCNDRFPSSICIRSTQLFRRLFNFHEKKWTFVFDAPGSRLRGRRFMDLEPLLEHVKDIGTCDRCR